MSDGRQAAAPAAEIEAIGAGELLARADSLRAAGWRLVQVLGISSAEDIELSYSFGLGPEMRVLRFNAAPGQAVPSLTPVFPAAYLYENELRDLFGVDIERISLDWLGKVYDTVSERPFSKVRIAMPGSEGGKR